MTREVHKTPEKLLQIEVRRLRDDVCFLATVIGQLRNLADEIERRKPSIRQIHHAAKP